MYTLTFFIEENKCNDNIQTCNSRILALHIYILFIYTDYRVFKHSTEIKKCVFSICWYNFLNQEILLYPPAKCFYFPKGISLVR